MAFVLSSAFSKISFSNKEKHISHTKSKYTCFNSLKFDQNLKRRSATYQPPIWDFEFVQSLRSTNLGEKNKNRMDKMKEEVKSQLIKLNTPLDQLEFIDVLQRLGLATHFQPLIQTILMRIYNEDYNKKKLMNKDLHDISLQFRLFRQNGFKVSQEIFSDFQDEDGNFKASVCEDCKGILSLYEASFLCEVNENVLEAAREIAALNLRKYITKNQKDSHMSKMINHALELPLHWRSQPLEARWFIDVYEEETRGSNPLVLELAKLEFNTVQETHQADLKYVSRWWESTGLSGKLSFARDMITENFLWSVGMTYAPHFANCRRLSAKLTSLITIIDDIYDVYGTFEELQLFTDAVVRWDMNGIEKLPYYMQICYLALYNSVNEIGYDILKEKGLYIMPFLKRAWVDLCQSYLLEAKWYHAKYTPTLEEYIENAGISSSVPLVLVHAFFLTEDAITINGLGSLNEYPQLLRLSSTIFRLANDLRTSSDEIKRGDVPKSIQCYMNETGASEEKAREHIRHLIRETWKKMNKEQHVDSRFSKVFIGITTDIIRIGNCMYKYKCEEETEHSETKDPVLSLLVEPCL